MTKISLFTKDQVLLASQKVKIASGDINSVTLKVEFDEKWDDYTSKVATFDNSNYNEALPECLLVDNQCVVPWEALSVAGTLSIGIVGDAVDGKRKTSTFIKFNILQGAKTGITTVSPSLDLYQQYIDAMVNLCDPVSKKLQSDFEELIAEHNAEFMQRMTELDTYMQGELLWENENPSAEFEAQTIPLDLTPYKRIEIGVYYSTTSTRSRRTTARVGDSFRIEGSASANIINGRTCEIKTDGVEFDNGSGNDKVIPFQIIGYKY